MTAVTPRPVRCTLETMIALRAVSDERLRQEERKAAGRFTHTCADPGPGAMTNAEKLAVLEEEVGEALEEWGWLALLLGVGGGRIAREVLTQDERRIARDTVGTKAALRGELVQVAAVAVAWIEAIDQELAKAAAGCERHRGDPHNLCDACMAAETA